MAPDGSQGVSAVPGGRASAAASGDGEGREIWKIGYHVSL
jgi:hypothetical protein